MISDTIFVIQNSPFVKWMTHNTLFYGSYGDGWIIATYGHCTSWMLYKYTIEQFYSFREKMHCIKLYCIYFKSMCLVTIPLVDYATLFCLEVTVAEETKELFIIFINIYVWNMPSFWWCLNVLKIHVESKSYFTLQSVVLHKLV